MRLTDRSALIAFLGGRGGRNPFRKDSDIISESFQILRFIFYFLLLQFIQLVASWWRWLEAEFVPCSVLLRFEISRVFFGTMS